MQNKLPAVFKKLYAAFGPQHWWPAESDFEVMLGAILTQNTSWSNVEQAISNLKKHNLLDPHKLYALPQQKLALLIRSAGYYNLKAARLKCFLGFFLNDCLADIPGMRAKGAGVLRKQLLAVKGIGPETADSILLYALKKPVFVVDAYTKRILGRHGLVSPQAEYHQVQDFFMRHLKKNVKLFNEFHALLVKLGKDYCRKQNPKCEVCPLWSIKRA